MATMEGLGGAGRDLAKYQYVYKIHWLGAILERNPAKPGSMVLANHSSALGNYL